MTDRDRRAGFCAAAASVVLIWLVPAAAWACGAMVPIFDVDGAEVVHDAEAMLYVVDDGELTVYQSRSIDSDVEEFAWLLPVPGEPTVEPGPQELFERLAEETQPTFERVDRADGDCISEVVSTKTVDEHGEVLSEESAPQTRGGGGGSSGSDGVRRVASGTVGPFDHVTITTDDELGDPAQKAVFWLEEHGYDLTAVDEEVLESYLADGLNLLAFRLRSEAESSDLRPVSITVDADRALSPLRLAKAGAADETRVLVWVAANHPVVPDGYAHVVPNETLVNWSRGGTDYDEIVARAVQEAGGQAFATDSTVETPQLAGLYLSDEDRRRWDAIRGAEPETADEKREVLKEILALDLLDDSVETGETSAETRRRRSRMNRRKRMGQTFATGVVADLWDELIAARKRTYGDMSVRANISGDAVRIGDRDVRWAESNLERTARSCYQQVVDEDAFPTYRLEAKVVPAVPSEVDIVETSSNDELDACIEEDLVDALERLADGEKSYDVSLRVSSEAPHLTEGAYVRTASQERADADVAEFIDRLDEEVMAPIQNFEQRLAAVDVVTRLSTTLRREDMTADVSFVEDPKAGRIDPRRTVERVVDCSPETTQRTEQTFSGRDTILIRFSRNWRFDPPRGTAIEGHGHSWRDEVDGLDAAYSITPADQD